MKKMYWMIWGLALNACAAVPVDAAGVGLPQKMEVNERYCPNSHNRNECSKVSVTRLEYAGAPWLTALLDQQLRRSLQGEEARAAVDLKGQIQAALREQTLVEKDKAWTTEIDNGIVAQGQALDWLAFTLETYQYNQGAAHGLSTRSHIMVNGRSRSVVDLNSILLNRSAQARLNELQRQAWMEWLRRSDWLNEGQSLADFMKQWPFEATNNWRIAKEALVFTFQPYAVCPYACGMPEIRIPITKLQRVVKPEVLEAARQWRSEVSLDKTAKH